MFSFGSDNLKTSNKDFFLWGMFYLVAHGGILLIPNAIYWDDWISYRMDSENIFEIFRQAGSMFNLAGYLHVAMLAIGPWIYKVSTFILMFASGLLLNLILKRHALLPVETRFFIVLLFLILPFNIARVALIDFGYTFFYFLFFLAWWLMDRYRVMALGLFFLSFNTNSLLVFYAVPILDALYRSGNFSSLKSILRFGIRRIDYILLPFVYFYIKVSFFSPSGFYEGYNQLFGIRDSINTLIETVLLQRNDVFHLLKYLYMVVGVKLCLFLAFFAFCFIKNKPLIVIENKMISWGLPIVGLFVFVLGAFPYWIGAHVPTFNDWSSRNQLLLPLGSALIITGGLSLINVSDKTKASSIIARASSAFNMSVISIIVGGSLAFNISIYTALFIDWQKQLQLIHLISNNSDINRAGLIVVQDKTQHLNVFKRTYRFYEWNGMLEAAFGDEKRFGIPESKLNDYLSGSLDIFFQDEWKAGAFRKDAALPPVLVEIDLIQPESFGEKIINSVFPKLTLSVSEIDLTNFQYH